MEQLFEVISSAVVSTFDYSFALGEQQFVHLGTGKEVTYFAVEKFIEKLARTEYELLIHEPSAQLDIENKRLGGNFYFGKDTKLLRASIEEEIALKRILCGDISEDSSYKKHFFYQGVESWKTEDFVLIEDYLSKGDATLFAKR